MGYNLFVGSDVVIDFFTDRDPYVNPKSELFELNGQGNLKLYLLVSAKVLNHQYSP